MSTQLATLPSRDEITAERCRRSLARFIREAWVIPEPSTPFLDNWHIDAMAEHLEAVSRGEITRLIINIPPGMAKSLVVSVFWPSWEWLTRPEGRWLAMSYVQSLSYRDARRMRRMIQTVPAPMADPSEPLFARLGYQGVLQLLGKDWKLMGDANAVERFDNSASGYRISSSFGGEGTGHRADRIVVDDPHSAADARSDVKRRSDLEWYDDTMPSRVNGPSASIVLVMQRLHSEDLTGHLLGQGGWEHLCLPAEYERGHPHVWIGDPRTKEGESLFPALLDTKLTDKQMTRLEEAKKQGDYIFSGQYQQRPAPREGGIFKEKWFRRYRTLGKGRLNLVQSWDCAFKDTDGSDYVVGQAWAQIGAHAFLIGQIRARLGFSQTKAAIRTMTDWLNEHYTIVGSHSILVEEKANGAAVIQELRRDIAGIIPINPKESKTARAYAVQPMIESGNVHLPATKAIPAPHPPELDPDNPDADPPEWEPTPVEAYLSELTAFDRGSFDDQVDATTQALRRMTSYGSGIVPPDADAIRDQPQTLTGDLLERDF